MSARTKHLKVLGLTDAADEATIKKAFKKLALLYHPDRNNNNVEEATERFKQINEAHTYLTSGAAPSQPRDDAAAGAGAPGTVLQRQNRRASRHRPRRSQSHHRRDRRRSVRPPKPNADLTRGRGAETGPGNRGSTARRRRGSQARSG